MIEACINNADLVSDDLAETMPELDLLLVDDHGRMGRGAAVLAHQSAVPPVSAKNSVRIPGKGHAGP